MIETGATLLRRPKGRTLDEFLQGGKLEPAEQTLLEACTSGDWAPIPADGETTRPGSPNESNCVRAGFLRFLALGGDTNAVLHERALRIKGAWIEGTLDFEGCQVPAWLEFEACTITGSLKVVDAEIKGLNLKDTSVSAIEGDRLHCRSAFALTDGTLVKRKVELSVARIDGDLLCLGCQISGADGAAFGALRAEIKGSVILANGFSAKGLVDFSGANIAGDLLCSGGHFKGHFDKANGTRGLALRLDQAKISSSIYLGCSEYEAKAGDKKAKKKACFHASGGVSMYTGRIGADLDCRGGRFKGSAENAALSLDGTEIKGGVFLTSDKEQQFHAMGLVRLETTKIRSDLVCTGGRFVGWVTKFKNKSAGVPAGRKQGLALSGDRANISGSVLLGSGFDATGGVGFRFATIGGDLGCGDGKFKSSHYYALNLEHSQIKGTFRFRDVSAMMGSIMFTAAHVAGLIDDEASWNKGKGLELDGFRYARFVREPYLADGKWTNPAPVDAASRIRWLDSLAKQHWRGNFKPEPWDVLITVLRETGHAEAAKEVAIAKNRRQLTQSGPLARLPHALYGRLYGFGYKPVYCLGWAAGICLIWAGLFWCGAEFGAMMPTDAKVMAEVKDSTCAANWVNCGELIGRYPTFNSLAYSLDYILPIVDLNQKKTWGPQIVCKSDSLCPSGMYVPLISDHPFSPIGAVVAILAFIENLFGWIAGGVLAAVMGGLIKKD
jgi:hypothetical protein